MCQKTISLFVAMFLGALPLIGQSDSSFPGNQERRSEFQGVQFLGLNTNRSQHKAPKYSHIGFVLWNRPVKSVQNGIYADFENLSSFGAEFSFQQIYIAVWGGGREEAFSYDPGSGQAFQTYTNPRALSIGVEPLVSI